MRNKVLILCPFLAALSIGCSQRGTYQAGGTSPSPDSSLTMAGRPSKYCLYPEEWKTILNQPVAFHCVRTEPKNCDPADSACEWEIVEENVPYVLAASDVEVAQTFRHDQKQMILKEVCPRPDDLDPKYYYTWKCHPPDWGSIYSVTLWENLSRPGSEKPQDGDHFNVYLRKVDDPSRLPGALVCGDGGVGGTGAMDVAGTGLATTDLEGKIIHVDIDGEGKRAMWFIHSDALKVDIAPADTRRKVDEVTFEEKDYDVFVDLLKAYLGESEKYVFLVEKGVVPDDDLSLPDSVDYEVFVILSEVKPEGKTLQLGTFNPILPKAPWFDFYIPESKPVVYLYPEEPQKVSVKVEPQDGWVTVSDPWYDPRMGWKNIQAYPDGQLIYQGQAYPYLYYETMVAGYDIPSRGFVLEKESLASFLDFSGRQLGLQDQEAEEFVNYWWERLREIDKDYFFVTFLDQKEIDRVDPLIITPDPETKIRVRVYFRPLDYPYSVDRPLVPQVPQRKGFTIVEWGGILDERERVD